MAAKKIYILLILLAVATAANAQKWYFKASAGYAWGAQKASVMQSSYTDLIANPQYSEHKYPNVSLGRGIVSNFAFGMHLDDNFFTELGLRLWNSDEIKSTNESHHLSSDSIKAHYYFYKTLGAKNTYINLSLGYKFTASKRVSFFAKTGLLIGKSYIFLNQHANNTYNDTTLILYYGYWYNTKPGIGFTTGVGVSYKLSKRVCLTGELAMQFLNVQITKRTATRFEVDGKNQLAQQSEAEKTINYYNGEPDTTWGPSPSKPFERPANPLIAPMGSWGLNVGVSYYF